LTINVNGCPNSCARFQVADIGFKGSLVNNENGETVEGFQVHLGGSLGPDSDFGRKLRAHKVTATEMPDYVQRVTEIYLAERHEGESFAAWTARPDEAQLR
jgi:sulfite reductase (ferredoxin)